MRKIIITLTLVLILTLIFAITACASTSETKVAGTTAEAVTPGESTAASTTKTETTTEAVKLTVSAAASLNDVMESIQVAYAKTAPNVKIVYNFGTSGTLQNQIEQGAPADLFISAAAKQMDALAAKNLIVTETRRNLLGNKLVLITPIDSTIKLGELKDLNSDAFTKIAIGEPKTVPAGQYTTEVLTINNLLASLTYKEKIVYAKDVREILTWVETGNADAGFVYSTDALTSDKVLAAMVIPESAHKPIIYPAAVLTDSANQKAATAFINYLYSDKARLIFEQFGFTYLAQ